MADKQDPFVNSARNYQLHQYLDRDRSSPLIQSNLSYATAGHLLETYVDALHCSLLMDEPSFIIRIKEAPETIRNPTFIRAAHRLPPPYVIEALGNYLESPSFFVKHIIGKPNEPARQDTQQPSATQFAQEAHALLRMSGIRYSEKVSIDYFPPRGSGDQITRDQWTRIRVQKPNAAVAEFRTAIAEYKQLFINFSKDYRLTHFVRGDDRAISQSTHLSPEQKKIVFDAFESSEELRSYNARLEPIIRKLIGALTPPALDYVFVQVGETTCRLSNKKLNPKFPLSTPALLHLSLGFVGRHQIDRTAFPKQAFNFTLSINGVESSVSDNIQLLNEHILKQYSLAGFPLDDDPLFSQASKQTFVDSISTHQNGIKLLLLFHRTAGLLEKIYPAHQHDVAYQDMEQLLAFNGETPHIERLERPVEAATLLYAIERRLRALSELDTELYNTIGELLNKAGHLARRSQFASVHPKLRVDILTRLSYIEEHETLASAERRAIFPAASLVREALIAT
jgi:hypothetical protein